MTALERAFDLARSGKALSVAEVKTLLKREGYSAEQINGPVLARQLSGLIKAARPENTNASRS